MILEIRTYRLKPAMADEFLHVMRAEAIPLLTKHGIDVVAFDRSLAAEDGNEEAYLIRSYPSLQAHHDQKDSFYTSQTWLEGPRNAVVSRIENYHTIVIETSPEAIETLRR
ncbi:NIPSNAP family protein [Kribbella sp. NPDC023855]|uniref:NIPSNAP family protein n=1 Tax=Kribbella sp. NPDC023855 TaxID=3154698 RepID=UPI0033F53CC8